MYAFKYAYVFILCASAKPAPRKHDQFELSFSTRQSEMMKTFDLSTCRSTLLILLLIPALAYGAKRCKTTEDCKNPELDEFCDKNFGACTSCSGYCTGAEETIPLCMQNCPSKSALSL